MVKLYMQSLVQYEIDTETGNVRVTKKFTSPIKGSQALSYKKSVKKATKVEEQEVKYL